MDWEIELSFDEYVFSKFMPAMHLCFLPYYIMRQLYRNARRMI